MMNVVAILSFHMTGLLSFIVMLPLMVTGSTNQNQQCDTGGTCFDQNYSNNNNNDRKEREREHQHVLSSPPPLECQTYMAPSTLGDETNMGMYTGVNLPPNIVVNWPEIVVPLLFREWDEHPEEYTDGTLWERYIWEGSVVNLETYDENDILKSKGKT